MLDLDKGDCRGAKLWQLAAHHLRTAAWPLPHVWPFCSLSCLSCGCRLGQWYKEVAQDTARARKCFQRALSLDANEAAAGVCSADMQLSSPSSDGATHRLTLHHCSLTSSSTLHPVMMASRLHEAQLPVKQSAMLDHHISCIHTAATHSRPCIAALSMHAPLCGNVHRSNWILPCEAQPSVPGKHSALPHQHLLHSPATMQQTGTSVRPGEAVCHAHTESPAHPQQQCTTPLLQARPCAPCWQPLAAAEWPMPCAWS